MSYNIGFYIEYVLGHITHARNLQTHVRRAEDVAAHWGLIGFDRGPIGERLPLFRSNWTVRAGLRARAALGHHARTTALDALFFHTQVPALFSIDWLRRLPSVVSVDATPKQMDSLGSFYEHAQSSPWVEQMKWRLNRACFHAVGRLVAWSEWAKQGLVDEYAVDPEKVAVIPPGVNVAEWRRPTPRVRHDGPVRVLFVGADLGRKGGHDLIAAWQALRPLGVELHLVTRERIAPEPGLFVYNSMQPNSAELKALYHCCDIFALPTYGDCLPMVLSEAGAAGMAVVSTQIAAIPEIVRHGDTGLLIPAGDRGALEQALRQLVVQPEVRLRLGEQAGRQIASAYDAAVNCGRLLDLIKAEIQQAERKKRLA